MPIVIHYFLFSIYHERNICILRCNINFNTLPAEIETSRDALQWLRRHIHDEILRRFQDIRLDSIDVIEFLVIRRPPPPTPTDQRPGESMDVDGEEENESITSANEQTDDEPLPTITIGSESWHSNFPAPWLPIITRDISRQRRQV